MVARTYRAWRNERNVTENELTPAAKRALEEAANRRAKRRKKVPAQELKGPRGPEPTRYGDWEKNGIVSDF